MRLYIIRHGETLWNTQRKLQGQTDIPLNENGRMLAAKTAQGMREIRFDLAVTSPLVRAAETARIVLGGRNIPLFQEKRIQEISFGELEGCVFQKDADEASNPELYRFFHAAERYQPAPGGETLEALCFRTGEFLEKLKTRKEWYGKNILVSTHGAASRALLANICKTPISAFWGPGVPQNCAVTIAELKIDREQDSEASDPVWKLKELDKIYYEDI